MLSQLTRYASVYEVPIYGCEIQLRGYFDQRGKLQLDDTPSGAQRLLYEVQLDSDAPEAQVRQMMRAVEQGCHARNTFAMPVEVRSTVKLNGRELPLGD
jgi:hypothetical protein